MTEKHIISENSGNLFLQLNNSSSHFYQVGRVNFDY